MKRRAVALVLGIGLCLGGCSNMFSGYYYSEEPHLQRVTVSGPTYAVEDMEDIRSALRDAIGSYETEMMLIGEGLSREELEEKLRLSYLEVQDQDPLAAYAVSGMSAKAGEVDENSVVTVYIEYRYDTRYLQSICPVPDMDTVAEQICSALDRREPELVLYVEQYEERDLMQIVEEHASRYPDRVMETPRILTGIYPYSGTSRVVEVIFTYTTDRASLERMQEQVVRSFDEAVAGLPEGASGMETCEYLWSFLRQRGKGQYDRSITPAYSLLCHGVGDSMAYAQVYGALCDRAGLDCQVIRGTRDGQGHCWAGIWLDGQLWHLELTGEEFVLRGDQEMAGYVWHLPEEPEGTDPV